MKMHRIALAMTIAAMALPVTAAQAAGSSKAKSPAAADQRKYCMQFEDLTGSRVRKFECRTKAQWAREGVDVEGQGRTRN